jgi:dTDP-4-dehydrorhamnose reductase/beta-phosphoglucomutase-like phosphatase (HAD superfamily)
MILVCGASGLVGTELCNLLRREQLAFIGTYNRNKIDKPNMFKMDFTDTDDVRKFICSNNITHCVWCIGERSLDICEHDWTYTKHINIDLVDIVSKVCSKLNIAFIHISTAYVFDGYNPPYNSNSPTNPLHNYGISKLISEMRVKHNMSGQQYHIVRAPVTYGSTGGIHNNIITMQGKYIMDLRFTSIAIDDIHIIRPLYVTDLCTYICNLCKSSCRPGLVRNLQHPTNKYTPYQICIIIGQYLGLSTDNIQRGSPSPVPSPVPVPVGGRVTDKNMISSSSNQYTDFKLSIDCCFNKFLIQDEVFVMLDFDGTIVDSHDAHYNAYAEAFHYVTGWHINDANIDVLMWIKITNVMSFDLYMKDIMKLSEREIVQIKARKAQTLDRYELSYIKNADLFIKHLLALKDHTNCDLCVVTNTSRNTVKIFQEKLPLLKSIQNWICREDYNQPKPDPECYDLAISRYYKGQRSVVGIEDSQIGNTSLCAIDKTKLSSAPVIFTYNNQTVFKDNDCYLFDDYAQLIPLFSSSTVLT